MFKIEVKWSCDFCECEEAHGHSARMEGEPITPPGWGRMEFLGLWPGRQSKVYIFCPNCASTLMKDEEEALSKASGETE